MPKGTRSITRAERFAAKVNLEGPVPAHRPELGSCFLWTGCVHPKGYGEFWDGKRVVQAHRWAWEQANGPVPADLELDHLCHNTRECPGGNSCPHRRCVNPDHLEPVTHAENLRRGHSSENGSAAMKARTACPQGHPYDAENTIVKRDGCRECRTCSVERTRKWRARKRQERERQNRLSTGPSASPR